MIPYKQMNPDKKNGESIAKKGLMRCIETWSEDEMIITFQRLRGADERLAKLAVKIESDHKNSHFFHDPTPPPEVIMAAAFRRQKGLVSILSQKMNPLFSARVSFLWFRSTVLNHFKVACPLNPEKDAHCEGVNHHKKRRAVSFRMLVSKNGISLEDLKTLRDSLTS